MNIEIEQHIDKEYYLEYYSQWLKYKSTFKKWEHIIGFTSVIIALLIYILNPKLQYFSIGFIFFGLFMINDFYSSRKKWIKERIKSRMNNSSFRILFKEDKIETIGKFARTESNWNFFSNVIKTEKGLILIPENGINPLCI